MKRSILPAIQKLKDPKAHSSVHSHSMIRMGEYFMPAFEYCVRFAALAILAEFYISVLYDRGGILKYLPAFFLMAGLLFIF